MSHLTWPEIGTLNCQGMIYSELRLEFTYAQEGRVSKNESKGICAGVVMAQQTADPISRNIPAAML